MKYLWGTSGMIVTG